MSKTLVIAEKPSVGRDIASAMPGAFAKHEGYLESDDMIVTWAVGHLVELVAPDEYGFVKWRMSDLPIVPDKFRLAPRDTKAKKQLDLIHKLIKRDDVEEIVNACDAGREGELIFAYTLETSKTKKPVKRLWLSSMTKKAIVEAFERLYVGRYLGGKRIKEDEAAKIVDETRGGTGTITKLEKKEEREQPNLLYDLTSLQRHANNLFGFSARRTLSAAQKLYEDKKAITYPRTNSKYLSTDLIEEIRPTASNVGQNREYAAAAQH